MKTRVLDSWAILEWISGRQPATDLVGKLLAEAEAGQTRLLMSAINVGEVYYFLMKHHSQDLAESWRTKWALEKRRKSWLICARSSKVARVQWLLR